MGGKQTHPFLLFPAGFDLPDEPIVGAATVHHLFKGWMALDQRRDRPAPWTSRATTAARAMRGRTPVEQSTTEPNGGHLGRPCHDVDRGRRLSCVDRPAPHEASGSSPSTAADTVDDTYDVDLVLLSHVHVDHLHLPSLKRLRPSARVLTPMGSAKLLRKAGFTDVTEIVSVTGSTRDPWSSRWCRQCTNAAAARTRE